MKKTFSTLLLLAASAFAQGPGPGGPPNPARQIARLTTLLNLTAAQQTQATTIFTNEQSTLAPIQAEVRAARTGLTTAIKSNQTATIDSLAAQPGSYSGQITSIQSKAQAAFYAILTATQQTQYDTLRGHGGGRPAFRGVRP